MMTSCSHHKPFAIAEENTWFLEDKGGDVYPIYCMANRKDKMAEPACFKAERSYLKKLSDKMVQVITPGTTNPIVAPQSEESAQPDAPSVPDDSYKTGPMKGIKKEPSQNILSL